MSRRAGSVIPTVRPSRVSLHKVTYPRVPGHEVVGRIEALGEGVASFELGQRVGVGFLAGEDGSCPSCRGGDLTNCHNLVISGITVDGGYAEVMLAEARGLVRIPTNSPPWTRRRCCVRG